MTLAERLINEGMDKGIKKGMEKGEIIGKIQLFQNLMGLPPYSKEYFTDMKIEYMNKILQQIEQQWQSFQAQKYAAS